MISIDMAWKSLNKYGEELCGDKVETLKTQDSDIVILADGMGSGVKANILATLTSKILATMFKEGAKLEDCVETIAKTLPICQERKVAYATFSILQIFHDGTAYLVEFDNPGCIFIRNNKIVNYPYETRVIEGKKIHEYSFQAQKNDCFVLMSDGALYASADENFDMLGWTWDHMSGYALDCTKITLSAARLTAMLSDMCDMLYGNNPKDDTTIAVTRIIERKIVNLFTGPPKHQEDDERIMKDFMKAHGKKVVAGGTSSKIAAKYLDKEIVTKAESSDSNVPPMATIDGLDLVIEGVLTLGKTLKLLQKYNDEEFDVEFFDELDKENGASKLAKLIIEECTDLNIFVGTALNEAHVDDDFSFELTRRKHLVRKFEEILTHMGKNVKVSYY
ncbi:MAG: SpoIIE family protein phosphatase [Schaedlerella sp.]|nr:SpoIIE family protein phosphatase [Schaedlerella sp.]